VKHLQPYADPLNFRVAPGDSAKPLEIQDGPGQKNGHSGGRASLRLVFGN
jgi:hypothetical protein